jgi:hypothetical protein
MPFESFESAVGEFRNFITSYSWPPTLRWLVKSRVRWNRRALYVYKPNSLTDSTAHRKRFQTALELNRNIAFIAYTKLNDLSFVGLETIGIDPPYTEYRESGSHNLKTLEYPVQLVSIESPAVWQLTRLFVRNSNPMCIGWPN